MIHSYYCSFTWSIFFFSFFFLTINVMILQLMIIIDCKFLCSNKLSITMIKFLVKLAYSGVFYSYFDPWEAHESFKWKKKKIYIYIYIDGICLFMCNVSAPLRTNSLRGSCPHGKYASAEWTRGGGFGSRHLIRSRNQIRSTYQIMGLEFGPIWLGNLLAT